MPDRDHGAPDPERLRRLEERLAQAKTSKAPSNARITMRHADTAWRMVIVSETVVVLTLVVIFA